MIVVPELEFVQVTAMGELELPDVGEHDGAVACEPVIV